jgi:hypothetical protein
MLRSPDQALAVRCPHGTFTLDDALAVGFTPWGVQARVRRGLWRELTRGVYASMTMPLQVADWERSAMRSYPGRAVRSHVSAARSWEIPAPEDDRAWVSVAANSRWVVPDRVRPVRTRHMPVSWVRDDLAITPPARTVVDLAMCSDASVLRDAIADALTRGLCRLDHVVDEMNLLSRRKGHATLRVLVERFRPEFESVLEEMLAGGFTRRAVLGFEPQYVVRDRTGGILARIDFADPTRRFGVETDGWAFHGSRVQQQRDKRRDRRLAQLGWVIVRFTTEEIITDLDAVVDEILAIRAARGSAA